MKKISIFFLLISLAWLPTQVAFASSFVSSMSDSAIESAPLHREKTSHCQMEMEQAMADCCGGDSVCNQMDNGCHQSVHFVAVTQDANQTILFSNYSNKNIYNHPLMSLSSLSAYRPPRFI